MEKNGAKNNAQNDLTPKQREMLALFDGEALTASDIALTVHKDIMTVRQHLKALVAGSHILSSKRGRVVYFHKEGVAVPEGEKRGGASVEDGETPDDGMQENKEDELGRDAERDEDSDEESELDEERDDESDDGEDDETVAPRRARRTGGNDFLVEGAVDPAKANAILDVKHFERQRLETLYADTPDYMLPVIQEALRSILSLTNDAAALDAEYERIRRQEGIDKKTLITWAIALSANGLTYADIAKKPDAPAAPTPPEPVVDVDDPANDDADQDDEGYAPPAPLPAPEPPVRTKRSYTRRRPPADIDEDEASEQPDRSIRIDPRLTPKQQMERDVFRKDSALLTVLESNLCATMTEVGCRLSEAEWSEYAMIVSVANGGQGGSAERFVALFRKAHPSIPAADARELAMLALTEENRRTDEAAARYGQLSAMYFRTA